MSHAPPPSPAAWYPDPTGRAELRWWDGADWTDQISVAGQRYLDPQGPGLPAAPVGGPPPAPVGERFQAPGPPAPPAGRTRSAGSGRRGLAIGVVAGVVVLALVAAAVVVTRDGDDDDDRADGSSSGTLDAATTYAVVIGADGGHVQIPESDPSGGGIALDVPPGALPADTELTLNTGPTLDGTIASLIEDEPAVWTALAGFALDAEDTRVHPAFGPPALAPLSAAVGPTIELGPDAMLLDQPAVVTVPRSLVDVDDDALVLALVRSGGEWEVAGEVEVGDDALRFELRHFTDVSFWDLFRNLASNPSGRPTREQYRAALATLAAGPSGDVTDGLLRGILCRAGVTFQPDAIPGVADLLQYLGNLQSPFGGPPQISRAPEGAYANLQSRLEQHRLGAAAGGNPTPHDLTFDVLIGLALDETGGDVFQALVLAHEVLRDHRDPGRTGHPPIHDIIQNVRGDPGGDENGARYHLLGVAVYAFALEHQRATDQWSAWYAPSPETVVAIEEAWVSGDIVSDTVEYAVDRLGARLGRQLYREYQAAVAGEPSDLRDRLCAEPVVTTTTAAATTTTVAETTTTTAPATTSSTVPEDIVVGTGDVQATVVWGGDSDVDLHVVDPSGEEIFFSAPTSASGGQLDHDDIPGCGSGPGTHVENIFWPTGRAPSGEYRAYLVLYNVCTDGGSQSAQLTVRVGGQVVVNQAITLTGRSSSSDLFPFTVP
jgi:hypothetical protein